MLGCELCLEDISKQSTYIARFWLDCVMTADQDEPFIYLSKPNGKDEECIKFLELKGYIKTTEVNRKNEVLIQLTEIKGVACKNPQHSKIPSDLDLN